MYVVREAGYHATPSHRLRGEIDLGMDPHTDSSDTEDTPETYTQGMAPLSLLPTMAPIKTSGDLVVFRKYGESEQDLIGTRLHCLHALAKVEYISGQKIGCSWWGTIWRCSRQAWNTGTSYECDEQMARGVVTYSQLRRLTKPVHLKSLLSSASQARHDPRICPTQLTFTTQVNTACDGKGTCFVHTLSGIMNGS